MHATDSDSGLMFGWINSAGGYLRFFHEEVGNTFSFNPVGTSLNTWYHLAVPRNGGSWRLFVDGIQLGATATSSITCQDFTE